MAYKSCVYRREKYCGQKLSEGSATTVFVAANFDGSVKPLLWSPVRVGNVSYIMII